MKARQPKGDEPQFAPEKDDGAPEGPDRLTQALSRGDAENAAACLTHSG